MGIRRREKRLFFDTLVWQRVLLLHWFPIIWIAVSGYSTLELPSHMPFYSKKPMIRTILKQSMPTTRMHPSFGTKITPHHRHKIALFQAICCPFFGGDMKMIQVENEDDGLLAAVSVPTFAAIPSSLISIELPVEKTDTRPTLESEIGYPSTTRGMSIPPSLLQATMEPIIGVPGAFRVMNFIPIDTCEETIHVCETKLQFQEFKAGKNNHGALQVLVTAQAAQSFADTLFPFVQKYFDRDSSQHNNHTPANPISDYQMIGVNRRWRVYRYEPGSMQNFAPHIDAGFPPSGLSADGNTLIWDDSENDLFYRPFSNVVSRLTILMYLNDDFEGGHTNFYHPFHSLPDSQGDSKELEKTDEKKECMLQILSAVKPLAGSILLFPQAVGEDAVDYARKYWPLHEGSPVTRGIRPKYVIRSDVLFATTMDKETEE